MIKFNDTNIIVGYIKQLLHSFNLPKYKVYTKEQEKFHENYLNSYKNNLVLQDEIKALEEEISELTAVDEESGQDSFFEKGINLLVTGVQRGSTFVPKTYKNTGRKSVMKINIDNQNNFINLEEKVSVEPGN